MDYRVWRYKTPPGFCAVEEIENVEREWELKEGKSRAKGFPKNAAFRMDPTLPKAIKLGEQISNREGLILVSGRVKALLGEAKVEKVEFLRVSILNHKGNLVSDDYWIVNPLDIQDCIDQEKSQFTWNALDPGFMATCRKLVLAPDRVSAKSNLFRAKHLPKILLVREDLADSIEGAGLSGTRMFELDEFQI